MQGILLQQNTNSLRGKLASALFCSIVILAASCGTTPQRPAYAGTDSVGVLSDDAFVGTWKYTILNPSVDEERDLSAIYRFEQDGSFTAKTEVQSDFPMKMESVGTWKVDGDKFVMSLDDIQETSGNEIAALAVSFTKVFMQKQSGIMNPYSIESDKIVMVSPEHGSALQLDRM